MKLSALKTLEVISIVAVFSALFGLGYQKGLIISMGFGNASGSYEIREILNSSVLALFYVFNKLQEIEMLERLTSSWQLMLYFSVICMGVFVIFAYFHKKPVKNEKSNNFNGSMKKILVSYKLSSLSGLLFGAISYVFAIAFGHILVSVLSLLVFPSALGLIIASN